MKTRCKRTVASDKFRKNGVWKERMQRRTPALCREHHKPADSRMEEYLLRGLVEKKTKTVFHNCAGATDSRAKRTLDNVLPPVRCTDLLAVISDVKATRKICAGRCGAQNAERGTGGTLQSCPGSAAWRQDVNSGPVDFERQEEHRPESMKKHLTYENKRTPALGREHHKPADPDGPTHTRRNWVPVGAFPDAHDPSPVWRGSAGHAHSASASKAIAPSASAAVPGSDY